MPNRSGKLQKLRQDVVGSRGKRSGSLVGDEVAEAGLLDRSVLNQQIEVILQEATLNASAAQHIEEHLESLVSLAREGDVRAAAGHVAALLNLELDDLRKAALLSLMVRLTGKRHFDPVAAYMLANRASYATTPG